MVKGIIKIILLIFILTSISLVFYLIIYREIGTKKDSKQNLLEKNHYKITNSSMKLTSSAFENNGFIPSKYTCDGENINPPLKIEGIPPDTKSLVLIVDDPDAPAGDWIHWILWNISPQTAGIEEGTIPPEANEGINDFGKRGYGGPCPPSGTHRYQFKLFALDTDLQLPSDIKKKDIENLISTHILDQAILVGLYQRAR